ncbi:Apoptogenic protein 1 [Schistosoma japonicum]|uniref:Apoptogenic protein 1 n=1 Tax=Schistosoma japonicum TaxID=6182 RepID=A0A4Z2D6K0_SCHJA|nr:Apoptogenic protein 1 [Schistosoma japonicum]
MWSYCIKFPKPINSTSARASAYGDLFISTGYCKTLSKTPVKTEESQSLKNKSYGPCSNSRSFQNSSNIQPLKLKSKLNETPLELKYRNVYQETWRWLDEYWSLYNLSYSKAKNAFLEKEQMKNCGNNSNKVKVPDIGVFHREFLDANKKQRIQFNLKWYRSIAYVVYLGILVDLQRVYRALYSKFTSKASQYEDINDKEIK